ncbi:MAG TPA: DUF364 domain-containing protein [Burkholderiaceae bacterium]|nr:DUF364 domain-containing protein [Burkholderiaceae bacterium]
MGREVGVELLELVARIDRRDALPPVAALHLPPAFTRGTREGEFCAVELEGGAIGLSYLLLGDTFDAMQRAQASLRIAGMPARELAGWYRDVDPVRRTLGFAAVNAVSQHWFRQSGFVFDWATDSIGRLDPQPGERIGMIGLFGPLTDRIVAAGARLTVLELDPRKLGDFDGYRVTVNPRELAGCAKVLSTTTILLNDTLGSVLEACRDARWLALVGPGGGCLPDPLFARGVTLLGGTAVVDRDGFAAALTRGEAWSRFARKYCIERERYAGFTCASP